LGVKGTKERRCVPVKETKPRKLLEAKVLEKGEEEEKKRVSPVLGFSGRHRRLEGRAKTGLDPAKP